MNSWAIPRRAFGTGNYRSRLSGDMLADHLHPRHFPTVSASTRCPCGTDAPVAVSQNFVDHCPPSLRHWYWIWSNCPSPCGLTLGFRTLLQPRRFITALSSVPAALRMYLTTSAPSRGQPVPAADGRLFGTVPGAPRPGNNHAGPMRECSCTRVTLRPCYFGRDGLSSRSRQGRLRRP